MSRRAILALALAGCGGGGAVVTPDANVVVAIDAAAPDAFVPDGHVATEPTVQSDCEVDGCVRALEPRASFDASTMRSSADPRTVVDNGVTVYRITFWSDGREVTGTLLVPLIPAPAEGFSTVVQGQSTTGLDDTCTPSAGLTGVGIGGQLAVRGLLVIVVDAPGLGTPGPEAWLVAQPSGRALLDAARAGPRLSEALGVPMTTRSVIVGHSQGGHSALAAAVERPTYAPELDVRGFGAADPASDARALVDDVMTRTDDSVSLGLTLFYAWQRWYGLRVAPYAVDPYFANADTLFQACFFNSSGSIGTLWDDIPHDGAQVFTPEIRAMAAADAWEEPWASLFVANTPVPAPGGPPIRIYQGETDYIVPAPINDHYVAKLQAAGVAVDYLTSPDSGHSDTAFGPLTTYQALGDDAVAWVRARLGLPAE